MNPAMWLDDLGKPAWIALVIVSFVLCWPIGLLLLGYLIGSGRMGCWGHQRNGERWQRRLERMQQRMQERAAQWCGPRTGAAWAGPSSGNWAFDEYRSETLRRLEEEQRQFTEYLERLRRAKDKSEFDQFMNEMRRGSNGGPPAHPQP
jgi:uncharacterized protein DUF2852